jgi:branched-chain amino acid transport system permease protein
MDGKPGMRMVIFSILLVAMIIFRREGIMGMREFSWNWVLSRPAAVRNRFASNKTPKGGD